MHVDFSGVDPPPAKVSICPARFPFSFIGDMSACSAPTLAPASPSRSSTGRTCISIANKAGITPEGFTYVPSQGRFLFGNFNGAADKGLTLFSNNGAEEMWARPEGMVHTFGIQMSYDGSEVLACNSTLYGGEYGGVFFLDAETGHSVRSVQLKGVYTPAGGTANPIFINDVTQDNKGNTYATDVRNPVVYKIAPDGTATVFAEDPRFMTGTDFLGLDGIVYDKANDVIVLGKIGFDGQSTFDSGLFRLSDLGNAAGPTITVTDIKFTAAVPNINSADGIAIGPDGTLVVMGSIVNQVTKLTTKDGWKTADVMAQVNTDPACQTDSAGVFVGDQLYVNCINGFDITKAPKIIRIDFDAAAPGDVSVESTCFDFPAPPSSSASSISPVPDSNNDAPSVVDDSGGITPDEAGWIGGVVGLVACVFVAGAIIMFKRWRSTGGRQKTSSNVALVGQRRTTNQQMNPARRSIVDAMDKDGSAV